MINSKSSHPIQMKKNVMVNEIMRIQRNCNQFCPQEEINQHILYFMKRLQFPGYDQEFRYEVVKKAMRKHRQRTSVTGGIQDQNLHRTSKKDMVPGRKWVRSSYVCTSNRRCSAEKGSPKMRWSSQNGTQSYWKGRKQHHQRAPKKQSIQGSQVWEKELPHMWK